MRGLFLSIDRNPSPVSNSLRSFEPPSPTRGEGKGRPLPNSTLQPRHRDAVARQLVGALIGVVTGMALDPVPAHLVLVQRRVQPLPQIDVLDRLLVRGAPAVPLPAMDPAGDALTHIL